MNGIGSSLLEWMRYSEDGQPLTTSYADYLLPTADHVPVVEIEHMESPTPVNPLGVKGAAESGTIGAPAAIVSAIEDALSPLGIVINDLPVTPARLRALIAAAEDGDDNEEYGILGRRDRRGVACGRNGHGPRRRDHRIA